jgi:hypothetical protein
MNKKLIIIVLVLIILIASGTYLYIRQTGSFLFNQAQVVNDKNANTGPETTTQTQTNYFIPVAGIKSTRNDIASNDLKSLKVNALTEDKEFLLQIPSFENQEFTYLESFDELSKRLNANIEEVGIMNFNHASFRLKTLSWDGVSLIDRATDLTKYNLKSVQEFTSVEAKESTSNFDTKEYRRIGFTGSLISARGVQAQIENKFGGDYTRLFKPTKPVLDSMDFVAGTLEAPFMGNGRACGTCMSFLGPDKFMDGIKYSGIDLLSMAGNHMMDGGTAAIANSQKKLAEAGVKYTGASTVNADDAAKPVLVDVNGLKIAYLGFNDAPGRSQWAGPNNPGTANISDWEVNSAGSTTKFAPSEERIKAYLQRAKDLQPDLIFVIMHWGGVEYQDQPTGYVRDLAKLLTKYGADAILGDHPHWVQEIQFVNEKPVFYSVGNYIFDQMWSVETRQGFNLGLDIYKDKIIGFKMYPHELNLYEEGTINLLKPEDKSYKQIINQVFRVSKFE